MPGKAPFMESAVAGLGLRERGKVDKRRRISEAARSVFTEFGYERANMREIAKRAGVATGTLFLYAPDKRNLLLWILNDDLDALTETSFEAVSGALEGSDLLAQLIYVFEARYHYWGKDPDLSRHALAELVYARDVQPAPATHLSYYQQRRIVLQERVAELVRAQQRRGRIRANADADADTIARVALAIYNSAIRIWLRGDETSVALGIAELRTLLRLALDGCRTVNARSAGETLN